MIKLIDMLNEIKVNNPIPKFPLKISSQKYWDDILPLLKRKGYKWASGNELKSEDYNKSVNSKFDYFYLFAYEDEPGIVRFGYSPNGYSSISKNI